MSDRARIEAFLEMMSAERGASPNTLDAYGRDLLDASEFCGGKLETAGPRDLAGGNERDEPSRGEPLAGRASFLRAFPDNAAQERTQ